MARIIPIRDLRDTNKISEMCRESADPIYVTRNGYGEMVIMSMFAYEEAMAKLEIHKAIAEGKAQADEGRVVDGPSFMKSLGEKHELI